jgi:hypothetical protein
MTDAAGLPGPLIGSGGPLMSTRSMAAGCCADTG